MAEGSSNMDDGVRPEREEVFSKSVRAGKRTYFFDVKTTRRNDYYLTLTESKKRFNRDGRFYFEKHKLFLYKEDFEKFTDGLAEAIEYIRQHAPEVIEHQHVKEAPSTQPAAVEETDKAAAERDQEVKEKSTGPVEANTVRDESAEEETSPAEEQEADGGEITDTISEKSFTNVEFEDLEDSK